LVGTREKVKVRLEIEFEVLAGELSIMEQDTKRMPLSKFIEVWSPEIKDANFMLRLVDIKEKRSGSKNKKRMD
jgi:hypothetical protein